jgi:hypothetical protein
MQSLLIKIGASVGNGCVNAKRDVFRVQLLINIWRNTEKKPEIKEDGICGPKTIEAITDFQRAKTKMADGRVDCDGPALAALNAHAEPYIKQSMAIIVLGIASSFPPPEQEPYSKRSGELPCSPRPLSNANLLAYNSFRQSGVRKS